MEPILLQLNQSMTLTCFKWGKVSHFYSFYKKKVTLKNIVGSWGLHFHHSKLSNTVNCVKNCDIFHGSLSLYTHTHIFKFQHNLFEWVVLDRKFKLIRWYNHQASKRDQLVKNMALNLFHHFFGHNSKMTNRE